VDTLTRPQERPQVGTTATPTDDVLALYVIIAQLRGENRSLRRKVRELEKSRHRWKVEANGWKWRVMRSVRRSSRGEAVSPTGRAEASVGG
jgi:hypothetical protein